jgi:hypothetical protein
VSDYRIPPESVESVDFSGLMGLLEDEDGCNMLLQMVEGSSEDGYNEDGRLCTHIYDVAYPSVKSPSLPQAPQYLDLVQVGCLPSKMVIF